MGAVSAVRGSRAQKTKHAPGSWIETINTRLSYAAPKQDINLTSTKRWGIGDRRHEEFGDV